MPLPSAHLPKIRKLSGSELVINYLRIMHILDYLSPARFEHFAGNGFLVNTCITLTCYILC